MSRVLRWPFGWRLAAGGWRLRLRRAALLACVLAAGALALLAVEVASLPRVEDLLRAAPGSAVLLDREGMPIRFALTSREELAPRVPLDRIGTWVRSATIAVEDRRFLSHTGVDALAVARALWLDVTRGRIVSGASTITMQVARLLEPHERSWHGKLREALLALRLETALGKDRILELYLNLSPYGGNVRGVEGAARRYFGRPASDLSLAEAALLAGLPQSPSRLRPDRHPEAARARRDRVLDRMAALGMITGAACDEAKRSPVRAGWHRLPLAAPHFGTWALARVAPGEAVRTTIDPAVQALAEGAVRRRLEALEGLRVRDGSAVVVETATGRIRALAGSADFASLRGGQVNGAASPRSPGSLLKPFIYAIALERGIVGPETILQDRPRRFRDGYEPRNFSGGFIGAVTVREALARSLNLPAVDVLERVGVEETLARLRAFGLRGLRSTAGAYGLSLGLGGVDVTLLQLVEAYAALGRGGEHAPLTFRDDRATAAGERVLSESAAWQVLDILGAVAYPGGEREAGMRVPPCAMKTGTSFGFRDAWAIAVTPVWTVGVWFGNFDAEPSRALVGQTAAVPAAMDIVRGLSPAAGAPAFPRPPVDGPAPAELVRRSGVTWIVPPDGATYVRHGRRGGSRMNLRAEIDGGGAGAAGGGPSGPSGSDDEPLAWFIDGSYVGRTASGDTLALPLERGSHRVTLVAPGGHAFARTVNVVE